MRVTVAVIKPARAADALDEGVVHAEEGGALQLLALAALEVGALVEVVVGRAAAEQLGPLVWQERVKKNDFPTETTYDCGPTYSW